MAGKVYKNNLQLEHAWGDGARAAAAGALIGTNPHPSGSEAWDAWNDGFSGIRT
jgi:hypothetical protein